MNPGIYTDLSNAEYHGGPGVNKSLLDIVARSPMHAKFYLESREAGERSPPTAAQALGTAFHSLLLEPEDFAATYIVAPKFDRRTKVGKEEAAAFEAEHAGKTPIDQETHDTLFGMARAVQAHPAAKALLAAPGKAEQSVYWTDELTGELCRCRPDFWREDGIIVDVKTSEDASPEGFAKSLVNYRYHVQAPWYCDGIEAATGEAPKGFVFLVVEKKPPFAVAVYALDAESMALGRIAARENLDTLARCRSSGVWPGYGDTIQQLGVPQWFLLRNAHLLENVA